MIKINSIFKDLSVRPIHYLNDIRLCPAASFSVGNVAFSITTGAIAGFTVGGLPAAAIQTVVTGWTIRNQMNATYQGRGYFAPYKPQAYTNWATAALMVTAPMALALAQNDIAALPHILATTLLPAAVFTGWGFCHWTTNKRIQRQEEIRTEQETVKKPEAEIDKIIENDTTHKKLLKKWYVLCGGTDIAATATAALSNGLHIAQVFPVILAATGLRKTLVPSVNARLTPSWYYGMAYLSAGAIAFTNSVTQNLASLFSAAPDVILTPPSLQNIFLIAAYAAWGRGYFMFDAKRPAPVSAETYQALKLDNNT